jgi:hypothetical protein
MMCYRKTNKIGPSFKINEKIELHTTKRVHGIKNPRKYPAIMYI